MKGEAYPSADPYTSGGLPITNPSLRMGELVATSALAGPSSLAPKTRLASVAWRPIAGVQAISIPHNYYELFVCLGSEFDRDADVTSFIHGHLSAQVQQVRALDLRINTEQQVWMAVEEAAEDVGMDRRLANALWDAFFGRNVTAGYHRSLTDVSPATATKDLTTAVAAGLLASEGERRGRRYFAGERLYGAVADRLSSRSRRHRPHGTGSSPSLAGGSRCLEMPSGSPRGRSRSPSTLSGHTRPRCSDTSQGRSVGGMFSKPAGLRKGHTWLRGPTG